VYTLHDAGHGILLLVGEMENAIIVVGRDIYTMVFRYFRPDWSATKTLLSCVQGLPPAIKTKLPIRASEAKAGVGEIWDLKKESLSA